MGEIAIKRELLRILNSAIPVMDDIELNTLAVATKTILENMEARGAVDYAEE